MLRFLVFLFLWRCNCLLMNVTKDVSARPLANAEPHQNVAGRELGQSAQTGTASRRQEAPSSSVHPPPFWKHWTSGMTVALTSACVLIVAAGLGNFALSMSGGDEAPRRVVADTEATNLDLVRWASVATCFCSINYTCLVPSIVTNSHASLLETGALICIYCVGSLLTYPLFRSIPAVQLKMALRLHAAFTLTGNAAMVFALCNGSSCMLFFGRLVCGMEAGVKFTSNRTVLELIRPEQRAEAALVNRLFTSVGISLGPAVGAFPAMALGALIPARVVRELPERWEEAVPLAIMCCYGAALLLCLALFFKREVKAAVEEGSKATTGHKERRLEAKVMFASTVITNFTQLFVKTALEAGAVVTFARVYTLGEMSNLIFFLQSLLLLLSRSLLVRVSRFVKNDRLTLQLLNRGMLVSCAHLFRLPFLPSHVSLAIFVWGSMVCYSLNSCQSGLLMVEASKVALEGDTYLSKPALATYNFLANITGNLCGPLIMLAAMHMTTGQNVAALVVAIPACIQGPITSFALSFRSREESPVMETEALTGGEAASKGL